MNEAALGNGQIAILHAPADFPDDSSEQPAQSAAPSRKRYHVRMVAGPDTTADAALPAAQDRCLLDKLALVYAISVAGIITHVNGMLCNATGHAAEELIGARYEALHPDIETWQSWRDLDRDSMPDRTGSWSGEMRMLAKNGSELWLSTTVVPVHDARGAVAGYCCAGIDISETVKLRRALDQSSGLMHLGQLTATVAHEIRNPLGAIRTAVFMLERKLKNSTDGVEVQLERINNGIRRCDKIITEMLDFSRKKTPNLNRLNVNAWLADVLQEECRNLPQGTIVNFSPSQTPIVACCDADQIRQVMINLINNAGEAMAEKASPNNVGSGYVPQLTIAAQLNRDIVEISVSDNGPGIDELNLARIREPLFTTKSFGVGLGLPAIEKILKNHGGGLDIRSKLGEGATMTASFRANAS